MPAFTIVLIFLTFFQFLFLLTTFDTFSKWISLIYKGFADAGGFIALFTLFIVTFFYGFRVLGIRFDDGENYGAEYNTDFNDFINVWPWMVGIIQIFRTSIGDI